MTKKAPAAAADAPATDPRTDALAALVAAGIAVSDAAHALASAAEGDKAAAQAALGEAEAQAKEAQAAVLALWDDGVDAVRDAVTALEEKLKELVGQSVSKDEVSALLEKHEAALREELPALTASPGPLPPAAPAEMVSGVLALDNIRVGGRLYCRGAAGISMPRAAYERLRDKHKAIAEE